MMNPFSKQVKTPAEIPLGEPGSHVSPSQLTTHARCPRSWWLAKVEGIPQQQGKAAARGNEIHALVDQALKASKDGHDPYEYVIQDQDVSSATKSFAIAALRQLQHMGVDLTTVTAEREVVVPWLSLGPDKWPVVMRGRIDIEENLSPIHDRHPRWRSRVIDIKTTGDVAERAKVPDELRYDSQAALYPWITGRLRFALLYVQTKGAPHSRSVEIRWSPAELKSAIEELKDQTREMIRHGNLPRDQVPTNTSACGAFGGCPYAKVCQDDGVFRRRGRT